MRTSPGDSHEVERDDAQLDTYASKIEVPNEGPHEEEGSTRGEVKQEEDTRTEKGGSQSRSPVKEADVAEDVKSGTSSKGNVSVVSGKTPKPAEGEDVGKSTPEDEVKGDETVNGLF